MGLLPTYKKLVADAIGDAFSVDEMKVIVKAATGNELFKEYAAEGDPLRKAVYKTLDDLMTAGQEHWLLIRVLISSVSNEQLRQLISKGAPDSVATSLNVGDRVDDALKCLNTIALIMLTPEYIHLLKLSGPVIAGLSDEILRLSAFKALHESLHGQYLKLSFGLAIDDHDPSPADDTMQICQNARLVMIDVGTDAPAELEWIDALEQSAMQFRAAVAHGDAVQRSAALSQMQRLIRLQLSWLNAKIFASADVLSLAVLMEITPLPVQNEAAFIQLNQDIRDLKAAVMARALLHKIWQDADNELALIENVLGVPANDTNQFVQHWYILRAQILWLASLDQGADWSREVTAQSDQIHAEMTREVIGDAMKPFVAKLSRILKFRFFAVDATLKADCGALSKFRAPLKTMVEEISNG